MPEEAHIGRIRQHLHAARELVRAHACAPVPAYAQCDAHRACVPLTSRARVARANRRARASRGAQGRRRRLRAKLPPMVLGMTCMLVGPCVAALLMQGAALTIVLVELTLIGLVIFLLSVLPTERRTVTASGLVTLCVHVLAILVVFLYVVLRVEHGDQKTADTLDARRDAPFFAFAAGTHLGVEHWCLSAEAWAADQTECAIRTVHFAAGIVQVTGWILGTTHVALSLARFAHGRPRLDALFFSLGCNCVIFGTAYTTFFVAAAALGGRASYPTPPASLVGHAVIIAVGALSLRPSLRAALVGWLAARGEAGSSAIAISSLMGAGSTDQVLESSRALLRAVSAEQLRASDFATVIVPADADARTRQAYAGEIDAFVSHRCARSPPCHRCARRRSAHARCVPGATARTHDDSGARLPRPCAVQLARRSGRKVGGARRVVRRL